MSMLQSQDKVNVDLTAELFLARITEKYDLEKAILFGSYARDEAGVQSDMDIAIILHGIHGQRADTVLLDDEDIDGACNRAYYAMFDAAHATLTHLCKTWVRRINVYAKSMRFVSFSTSYELIVAIHGIIEK